jgi:hypothetical protein
MSMKQVLLAIIAIALLSSCELINTSLKYKSTGKAFCEALMKEDYDACISYMAMEHERAKNANIDTLKKGLANFREKIAQDFGTDLEYSFMKLEKKFSSNEKENANTTELLLEFSNEKEFDVFKILFDDESEKILYINTLDVKRPVPSMAIFWLFGLLAICIPIFNIYVITRIRKRRLKKRWLKYIAILLLNVPAITYTAINGLSFKLLSFQILFGISFSYMGYLGSYWTIGIPLGGIYWFLKLMKQSNLPTESIDNGSSEIIDIPNQEGTQL